MVTWYHCQTKLKQLNISLLLSIFHDIPITSNKSWGFDGLLTFFPPGFVSSRAMPLLRLVRSADSIITLFYQMYCKVSRSYRYIQYVCIRVYIYTYIHTVYVQYIYVYIYVSLSVIYLRSIFASTCISF